MLLTEQNLHVWLFDFAAKIKAGFRTKDLGGPYCHLVVKCCKIHLRAAWTEDTFLQCS